MKTLTKTLAPLVLLTCMLALPAKSQNLVINQASQLQDTIPLGSQVSLSWQIANGGSDSLNTDNGIDITMTIGNDSVNGFGLNLNSKFPPNNVFPGNANQFPLTEVLDRNEYSEGTTDICIIATNNTGQNAGRDTFCQTVYLKDADVDIGVTQIILPDNNQEVFRDSLVTVDLLVENFGSDMVRDSLPFPIRTIIESPGNRILDTFARNVSFDEPLMPGNSDTVSTVLYVSPATDTGTYNYNAETRWANAPLSTDPDSTNDASSTQIDVINKYNVEVGFTGFDDGDTVLKGGRIETAISLTNEGPGLLRSFDVQTQGGGTQTIPAVIVDALNFGINGNFSDQNEVSRQITGTLPQNASIVPNYGLTTRIDANTQNDSIQVCAFHEARVPSRQSLAITGNTVEFASIRDTTCITLFIDDKTIDIGMASIQPVNSVETDSTNLFEVTIENFSGSKVESSQRIPTSVFIGDIGFSVGKQISLSSSIPANGTITDTINLNLSQAEKGQYTLGIETQWDASRFGIDNNPDNDTATVEIDTEKVDGIASHDMVSGTSIYPNPANANTRLTYSLKETQQVTVTLQNMKGQTVQVLEQGQQASGEQTINFNVKGLEAGTYIYNIQTEEGQTNGRLVVK